LLVTTDIEHELRDQLGQEAPIHGALPIALLRTQAPLAIHRVFDRHLPKIVVLLLVVAEKALTALVREVRAGHTSPPEGWSG
jgi:hypothetical protein